MIEASFPLFFICGLVSDVSSRNTLSSIISGPTGIKNLMDGSMGGTFLQDARVVDCRIETMMIGAIEYLVANFQLDVIA